MERVRSVMKDEVGRKMEGGAGRMMRKSRERCDGRRFGDDF